jgi:L-ascorbate metabolism protein UlaG (beta-lactamase superfamily)
VRVFSDPFGDMSALAERGLEWDYPPIAGVTADVLLVTHEHRDHNAVEVIEGEPHVKPSGSALFKAIELAKPTVLIDEVCSEDEAPVERLLDRAAPLPD